MSGIAAQRAESALNCRVIHVSVMIIVSRKTNKQTNTHPFSIPPSSYTQDRGGLLEPK